MKDLPDLIKLSCEFAFEYLASLTSDVSNSSSSIDDDKSITDYIFNMLTKLKALISVKQEGIVMEMRAGLLAHVGYTDLRRHHYDAALAHLRQSLSVYDDMQANRVSTDRRSYYTVRANLAQALCMTGDLGLT